MLAIRNIPIERIKAYENNPRHISEYAVKKLVNSIREFGFKVPVVLDENYVIVAGHTRVLAAREIGMTDIPCIVADDLTPSQIKAFRLADNKTGELTSWDIEKLDIELEDLAVLDVDMSELGFQIDATEQKMDMLGEDVASFSEKKERECPNCGFKF